MKGTKSILLPLLATSIGLFGMSSASAAVTYSLTAVGSQATINGAIFYVPASDGSTGTGVIHSFVRIGGNDDTKQGYNTSDRPLQFDENNAPPFTRDLLLSELPIVITNGVQYYEFILDINQTNADPLLSLNRVHIFSGANQLTDKTSYSSTGLAAASATLGALSSIYSLDSGDADNTITLDYSNYGGSGDNLDMIMLVPVSLFGTGPNVYLYSYFGDPDNANDGFEEWAIRVRGTPACPPLDPNCGFIPSIPEPGTLALLGLGLAGLAASRRRKQ
jgi:hypothetical protein